MVLLKRNKDGPEALISIGLKLLLKLRRKKNLDSRRVACLEGKKLLETEMTKASPDLPSEPTESKEMRVRRTKMLSPRNSLIASLSLKLTRIKDS